MKPFVASLAIFLVVSCAFGDSPPVAPVRPVTDDYFRTKIVDPYRYMENLDDPQVQSWIKAQADYAARTLHSIPGRDALLQRIQQLDEGAPYRLWIVKRGPNGDLHYLKRLASENTEKLYFHDAATNIDRLLVDPDRFVSPGTSAHYSLEFARPSPDERYVAYGVAASGSEQTTLHVFDLQSNKDLPDTIDRIENAYSDADWLPDSRAFLYSRRRKLPADAPETEGYKQTRAYLHRLGTDPDSDPQILGMGISPAVPLPDTDFPSLHLTTGSRWIVAKIKHGDDVELTLYSAPLDSLASGNIPWKKICDVADGVEDYAVHGDDIYLRTSAAAPRYRIVETLLDHPDFSSAQTVVAQGDLVIESLAAARDALYIGLLDGGLESVDRLAYQSAAPTPIPTPAGFSSAYLDQADTNTDGAVVYTESWTRASRLCVADPKSNQLIDTNLVPVGQFDNVPGYTSEEVLVASHDGVKVPLSIFHKTDLPLDGTHPTLIEGYGAYGISLTADFYPPDLAWMERGGVLAIAHVRGGGEYGDAWHRAGQKSTKPNTWNDFLACCQYLIDQHYTSPAKLAGEGGSAGGITIGRAITQRPDLFAAALISVGCTDALRFETTTNGVPNIPEFGTVTTKDGFVGLLEMSAYAHIHDGVKYPAVLLTHGIHDPRVAPWMSAKMTARLQAATSSGKPILFRVDYDAGHGIGSTRQQREETLADQWAFLLWQMGESGFQPR